MDSAKLNDWMQIIGIFSVVASLLFVGMQLKQEEQIALSQIHQADEASSTQIDLAVAENAEIWLKSNNGDSLNEAERLIMSRLVAAMYRRARLETNMRRTLGQFSDASIVDFAIELHENPGAREFWEAQAAAEAAYFRELRPDDPYRESYHQDVLAELEKLDRTFPP